jgi:hypothetical protein
MKLYVLFIFLFFFSCNTPESAISNSDKQSLFPIIASDNILAFVYSENGKSGLMDTSSNVILPAQFDYIEPWQVDNLIRIDSGGKVINDGDAVGYKFKKYGLINIKGKILFRPQFDDMTVSDGSALVRVDSLFGFVDNKGNWLIKPKYRLAYPFYKGTAVIKDSGQFGLLNKQGQKIIKQTFDGIWGFKNNISVVEKDNKKGFINYHGTYILPLDNYSSIGEYNWYFGEFKKDGKWFVIDTTGHIPIKEGFDEVKVRGNEDSVFAIGKQNGKDVKIRIK